MSAKPVYQHLNDYSVEPATVTSTVLLVESDDTLLDSLGQLFENDGFSVLTASSGKNALGIYLQHRGQIGILITDVAVGMINGFDLAAAVSTTCPDVTVLFTAPPPLPSHDQPCHVCHRAVAHFLPKPYRYSELRRRLAQLLAEKEEATPEWLAHFYNVPVSPEALAMIFPKEENRKQGRIPETHSITVQLQAVERDEVLAVAGVVRNPDGTDTKCFIEPQIKTLRAWRTLRVSDLNDTVRSVIRLLVQEVEGELADISQGKRSKTRHHNRNTFGLLLLAALYGHNDDHPLPAGSPIKGPQWWTDRKDIIPLDQLEKEAITSAVTLFGGNKLQAAASLGVSRSALYRKITQYGIVVNKPLL